MNRRTVAGTFFSVILIAGAAAVIGAPPLPIVSPYSDMLILGGLVSIAVGSVGLLWLFVFQPRRADLTSRKRED
jgi:hypothetical protein